MRVLGLHTLYHDAGAAIVDADNLVTISEERLNRRKHSGDFPSLSIEYVMAMTGTADINDFDMVCVDHVKDLKRKGLIEQQLRDYGYRGEITFVSHHDAHAASAFFVSPYETAAVLIVDGRGSSAHVESADHKPHYLLAPFEESYELQSYYRGVGNKLHLIKRTMSTPDCVNGIGNIYTGVSRFLNFGEFGAGKVMGLAPYGKGTDEKFRRVLWDDFSGDVIYRGGVKMRGEKGRKRFAKQYFPGIKPRKDQELPDDLYTEIAYWAQFNCETAVSRMAEYLFDVTREKYMCMAGGVALNSVTNKKILDEGVFEEMFIQPACSDAGIPLGCALYGYHVLGGNPHVHRMRTAYTGREYSAGEIESAIEEIPDKSGLEIGREEDVVRYAAGILTDEKIVGWHQGGSEIGPRALGHRSIVCDPRKAYMKDRLNHQVKHREGFRPFAPSILVEDTADYFKLRGDSPFMLLIAEVHASKTEEIAAAVHVDGTGRVQTVSKEDNGLYYDLIAAFRDLTGVPVVLNTSFNVAGEPIVEAPADSIKCFLGTDIDVLVVGNYVIRKN